MNNNNTNQPDFSLDTLEIIKTIGTGDTLDFKRRVRSDLDTNMQELLLQ